MAFGNLCIRCGYEEDEHEPNLVNEPDIDENAWLDESQEGYQLSILECMETPYPPDYAKREVSLRWKGKRESTFGCGYVSPDPEDEASRPDTDAEGLPAILLITASGHVIDISG